MQAGGGGGISRRALDCGAGRRQGRTVKDVIHWAFAGPALFCFIWLAVFGGAGLRMERQARDENGAGRGVLGGGETGA